MNAEQAVPTRVTETFSAKDHLNGCLPAGRVFWLKTVVSLGLITSFLLSYKLWIGPRSYPFTPLWPFVKPLGPSFNDGLFAVLLMLLAFTVVVRNPAKLIAAFVFLALILAVFDQSRWQPWFYQYLLLLAALGLWFANVNHPQNQAAALNTCRLIVVCTYFWSGVQKINTTFVYETFPWLIDRLPASLRPWLVFLGFLAPFIELGIGVALLTRRFRTYAVLAALLMHVGILACIGPWAKDFNSVVWPWNLAMCALVILLFWRTGEVCATSVVWGRSLAYQKLVVLLFGVLPVLSLFNLWDSFLSFTLYSGNKNSATIYMADSVAEKLPDDVQVLMTEDEPKLKALDVSDWSWVGLNVPSYPEIRIFKNIARVVCASAIRQSDVKLVIEEKTTLLGGGHERVYDCSSLTK